MTALGIGIDENGTFEIYMWTIIYVEANREIYALGLSGLLDLHTRKTIYNSFISSHFKHCPLVWVFTSKFSAAKMLKNKANRASFRYILKDSVPVAPFTSMV